MRHLQEYVERAIEIGVTKAKIIEPRTVAVENWVQLKCQYGCEGYGKRVTCPPNWPTPETFSNSLFHLYEGQDQILLLPSIFR